MAPPGRRAHRQGMATHLRVGLVLGVGALALAACGGGDGSRSDGAAVDVAPLVEAALIDVEVAPDASGAEQLLELFGVPDAFVVSFESDDVDGPLIRRETWQYLEIGSEFELIDGEVVSFAPLDLDPADDSTVWLSAGWLDPRDFEPDTGLDAIASMLGDADVLVSTELPDDLGGLTAYAGDQLLVVFEGDRLAHAETFFLGSGEDQP